MENSSKIEVKNLHRNDLFDNNKKMYADALKDIEISSTNISNSMPQDIMKKIKKRAICIDDVLDLHGYTLENAQKTFIFFIRKNFSAQKRLLIIITGKGGVIRSEIKSWINSSTVCNCILYWNVACPRDGGDGALYIYLRKNS
ncbi:Smr/MutS family protein [Anaplasmataceae bacterium AB001_6]|nr:Smr/MutS family protein [Anaplasmataceae bacterium AB001_6]